MRRIAGIAFFIHISLSPVAHADLASCGRALTSSAPVQWVKQKAIWLLIKGMAIKAGLYKYKRLIAKSKATGSYRRDYDNFGHMGLAELGIGVRYDAKRFEALNTGRPLIVVANHHLGIGDGLALQYLMARARPDSQSLLLLARWIQRLLPHAVYGDEFGWGTALPIEINWPKVGDPNYDAKMAEVTKFNARPMGKSARVLKRGGTLIIFPAGHVASVLPGEAYPAGVRDAPGSWQETVLGLARAGKADIVFAHVDSVNSEAFYRDRKRFGGGDDERMLWFLKEAVRKRGQAIDVHLSAPMSRAEVTALLAAKYEHAPEALDADPALMVDSMRRFVYDLHENFPQSLDAIDWPSRGRTVPEAPAEEAVPVPPDDPFRTAS